MSLWPPACLSSVLLWSRTPLGGIVTLGWVDKVVAVHSHAAVMLKAPTCLLPHRLWRLCRAAPVPDFLIFSFWLGYFVHKIAEWLWKVLPLCLCCCIKNKNKNKIKITRKFITHLFEIPKGFQKSAKCFSVIFLGCTFFCFVLLLGILQHVTAHCASVCGHFWCQRNI